jgi:DNA-binding MarR family transcriptional regulator
MTQLVDRLEAEGLVTRTNDPSDRRVVRAEITAKGREQTTAGRAKIKGIEKEFTNALSDEDHLTLDRILSAVR